MAEEVGGTHELQEKVRERNERLKALREKLAEVRRREGNKDREIKALRAHLARIQSPSSLASSPGRQEVPVFFLVGQAKSGTSWLMRTLDAHPEILCKGEGRLFGRDYKREDIKQMDTKTIQPSSLYRAILDADYLNAWIERSGWTRDDDKEEHLDGLTRAAIDYFLTEKLSRSGKRIVGDKTPFLNEKIVGEVSDIYPEARVIHIIRDGRDAAVSSMHHFWNHPVDLGGRQDLGPEELAKRDAYREDPQGFLETGESLFTESRLRNLAETWSLQVSQAMQDGPKHFGERYAEVRYEDLLEEPEKEIVCLLGFLGADASRESVEHCVGSASFESWSRGRERGREDSTAFLRKGVSGDWKNVFTEKDRRIFKEVAGETLVKLGYEKGYDW